MDHSIIDAIAELYLASFVEKAVDEIDREDITLHDEQSLDEQAAMVSAAISDQDGFLAIADFETIIGAVEANIRDELEEHVANGRKGLEAILATVLSNRQRR